MQGPVGYNPFPMIGLIKNRAARLNLVLLLLLGCLGLASCESTTAVTGIKLLYLEPGQGAVGAKVVLNGYGFGNAFQPRERFVSFGGIQATAGDILSWTDREIAMLIPGGTPVGNVLAVVTVSGVSSNGLPYLVTHDPGPGNDGGLPDGGPPPDGGAPDGGAPDGGAPDGGPPSDGGAPDGGPPPDGGPLDGGWAFRFTPDSPEQANRLNLVWGGQEGSRIHIDVVGNGLGEVFGIAFHLLFDSRALLLEAVIDLGALNSDWTGVVMKHLEKPPGRLMVGLVRTGPQRGLNLRGRTPLFRLTFQVIGTGNSSLVFKPGDRTVRDGLNRDKGVTWSGGTLSRTGAP